MYAPPGPNSSSRSVSMSMDDSAHLQRQPINQMMKTVNEQTLLVRKPTERPIDQKKIETQPDAHGKSPATTNLTPQPLTDRINNPIAKELNDLLLINEEPSNKEQSQQLVYSQVTHSIIPQEVSKLNEALPQRNLMIDEKLKNSFSEVRWSRMISSRSSVSHKSLIEHQFAVIRDKAAQLILDPQGIVQYCIQWVFQPNKPNFVLNLAYNTVSSLYFLLFLTVMLYELQTNQSTLTSYPANQIVILTAVLYEILREIKTHKHKNGLLVRNPFDLALIYLLSPNFLFDLFTLLAIFNNLTFLSYPIFNLLFVFRILKINTTFHLWETILQCRSALCLARMVVEFHLVANAYQSFLNILQNQFTSSLYELGLLNILSSPSFQDIPLDQQIGIYIAQFLILVYLCHLVHQVVTHAPFEPSFLAGLQISFQDKLACADRLASLRKQQQQANFDENENLLPPETRDNFKRQMYTKLLGSISIFHSSFSPRSLSEMATLCAECTYTPNSTILYPSSKNHSLYFVLAGEVQAYQQNDCTTFTLQVLSKGSSFNNLAFFQGNLPSFGIKSIGYSRILQLDFDLFQDFLRKKFVEKQKFRMILDQIILYQNYQLAGVTCYACGKHHDIDHCPNVHYIPKNNILLSYIQEQNDNSRVYQQRRNLRVHKRRTKDTMQRIEEAAILFQQINFIDQSLSDKHYYRNYSEYQPSINRQFTTPPYTSPAHEIEERQNPTQPFLQPEDNRSAAGAQQQGNVMELNISPVQYVQQPASGFSHSSYQFLLKDNSLNNNGIAKKGKVEGSDKDKNSSNMFSVPYSSSGTSKNNLKGSKNSDLLGQLKVMEQQPQGAQQLENETLSIQIKKSKNINLQDSLFYHQKRLFQQKQGSSGPDDSASSKYKKYYTGIQKSQKSERSERKSNSLINDYVSERERGVLSQIQELEQRQLSKVMIVASQYAIQSSKFTGETAKQFMQNPLDIPNLEFHQSFERSNQFSDYFPQQNVDQAIESYKQYQASRSSRNNQSKLP